MLHFSYIIKGGRLCLEKHVSLVLLVFITLLWNEKKDLFIMRGTFDMVPLITFCNVS